MTLTAIFLLALYAMAVYLKGPVVWEGEMGRVMGVGIGFLGIHFLGSLKWKAKPRWENLVISLMLLLLLSHFQTSFWQMMMLGAVTGVIKTVLRLENQPIFNAAAAGLLVSSFFGVLTSWWGVSFAPRLPIFNMSVAILLTLPVGLYLIGLYKRVPTLIGVPVVFLVVYYLLTGRWALTTVLEGTFMFFLLIMATEPKTTPLIDVQEVVYALILGSLLAMLFVYRIAGEPYLVALLMVNFLFAIFKWVEVKVSMKG